VAQVVEIKPAPDGDGFCLHLKGVSPIWFAFEHQAVNYAQDVYSTYEIVVYAGEGVIARKYPPATQE
jgi:hypothetical protein